MMFNVQTKKFYIDAKQSKREKLPREPWMAEGIKFSLRSLLLQGLEFILNW